MQKETKTCQNCHNGFVIEPDDFEFYAKMQVPAPTFCPECRNQRRFSWRNERNLYKRKDSLTGEDLISVYSPDKPFVIYSQKNWWSDNWNPMSYGCNYDFTKPFFLQFSELLKKSLLPRFPM